jgi:hypothetical protein
MFSKKIIDLKFMCKDQHKFFSNMELFFTIFIKIL